LDIVNWEVLKVKVIAVFASTLNGKISLSEDDKTEWTSREDKRYFKSLTSSVGIVIMGRKTHEAIGRALPDRLNIVLTRNPDYYRPSENLIFTSSTPKELLEDLERKGHDEVCLIGGAETFDHFADLGLVNELHITFEPIIRTGIAGLGETMERDLDLSLKEFRKLGEAILTVYEVK
jgi:dihydrofolate reductase